MATCYHCHQPGHFQADCPYTTVATSHDGHLARIAGFVNLWIEERLTTEQKRRLISDENTLYYGSGCSPRLQYHHEK